MKLVKMEKAQLHIFLSGSIALVIGSTGHLVSALVLKDNVI